MTGRCLDKQDWHQFLNGIRLQVRREANGIYFAPKKLCAYPGKTQST